MASWGHFVIKNPTPTQWGCRSRAKKTDGPGKPGICGEKGAYIVGYTYITGKAGRTTRRDMEKCEAHAKQFAEKHGLEMPS